MAAPLRTLSIARAPGLVVGLGWPLPGAPRRPGEPAPGPAWFWSLAPPCPAPPGQAPACVGVAGDPWASASGALWVRRLLLDLAARGTRDLAVIAADPAVVDALPWIRAAARGGRPGLWVRLPSLDEHVCEAVEPGGPPPSVRLSLIRALARAGHAPGVVVPAVQELNDAPRALSALCARARAEGARRAALAAVEPDEAVFALVRMGTARREPGAAMAPDVYAAWLGVLAARLRRQPPVDWTAAPRPPALPRGDAPRRVRKADRGSPQLAFRLPGTEARA